MNTQTTALRNRVYRDLASDRMAYAETRDATHRDGERYVWRDDPPRAAYAHIPQRRPERAPFDWGAFWLKVAAAAFIVVVWGGVIWLAARGGVRWS